MSKLHYYNSLKEKIKLFSSDNFYKINTKDKLNEFINFLEQRYLRQKNKLSIIYRGIHEAKYKIYSSGQRSWQTKEIFNFDSYQAMNQKISTKALNLRNNLLDSFYGELGVLNKLLATMSFLQHYGSPTPLTDWTHSNDVGLFFTNYLYRHHESDNDDINNYMSLYEIDLEEQGNELVNMAMLAKTSSEDGNYYAKGKKFSPTSIIRNFNLNSFFKFKLFYLSDFYRKGNLPRTYINSNLNIISQKGLFIFNASEDKPLEEIFSAYENDSKDEINFHLKKIKCYNIHKNLIEYIIEYLASKSISKKTMFPQEEELSQESFKTYLGS